MPPRPGHSAALLLFFLLSGCTATRSIEVVNTTSGQIYWNNTAFSTFSTSLRQDSFAHPGPNKTDRLIIASARSFEFLPDMWLFHLSFYGSKQSVASDCIQWKDGGFVYTVPLPEDIQEQIGTWRAKSWLRQTFSSDLGKCFVLPNGTLLWEIDGDDRLLEATKHTASLEE